ncbi:prepilin-type N-terminal cleavage/methylation domain-containing protein [Ruminococcus albus]|uniref:prepilin-type N-terminal cleavage/methylation domain-containing protein n=1 Tax=Ruminococcus albus TaxID=1264 RepID=UPI00046356FD|nr:prepilin-type N-terminal cleavage/methylation domain-containing protein [Ruminococcus albus]
MKNSNKKGFTLVELVVVIAIIGVLAAILVPSMMGYVKKSRLKTANGNAKTAYNAVAEYLADQETQGLIASASEATAKQSAEDELSTNGEGSGEVAVQFADDMTVANPEFTVQWHRAAGDEIVGQYPDPAYEVADTPTYKTFKPA